MARTLACDAIAVTAGFGFVLALGPAWAVAQPPIPRSDVRGRMVERDIRVTHVAPDWLASPEPGRLETSDGLGMQPLQNAVVSYENAGLGMLVGAFRNTGRCAHDVQVRLQYADEQWQPLGEPLENEARVSLIEPDGLLPYRFRLRRKSDFARPPAGYVLQVVEGGKPIGRGIRWIEPDRPAVRRPCPPRPYEFEISTRATRSQARSYRVSGTLRVRAGGPLRPDGITLTALLLDKDDQVLEVLTGTPDVQGLTLPTGFLRDSDVVPFTLATPVPLGKWVAEVRVFAEVLPDAELATPAR